jgi:hypothetical protein
MQKNGAGFYAGSSVYWDNSHDGTCQMNCRVYATHMYIDYLLRLNSSYIRKCKLPIRKQIFVRYCQRIWIECLTESIWKRIKSKKKKYIHFVSPIVGLPTVFKKKLVVDPIFFFLCLSIPLP